VVMGDGLMYQLPADGAWVDYDFESKAVAKLPNGQNQLYSSRGRTKLSSIGKVDWKGEAHRWIELNWEVWPADEEGTRTTRILKLLIPEKRLKRGEDPFAHVQKMYYAQATGAKEVQSDKLHIEEIDETITIAENYTRREYELDRFRSICPKPITDAKSDRETVQTAVGSLDCETLSGTSEMPAGTPLQSGKHWGWTRRFQCQLHVNVPFGVVSVRSKSKGYESIGDSQKIELQGDSALVLAQVGRDAQSVLPDSW
jgi:hypothetical protein